MNKVILPEKEPLDGSEVYPDTEEGFNRWMVYRSLMSLVTHRGSCHCGAVRFQVEAPAVIEATLCNCSICTMSGFLHLIVPRSHFHLQAGEENLTTYRFNTGIARHTFCANCGVKPFYVPRSNPDGYSVNVNCLDAGTIERVEIQPFDGRNWEETAHRLRHLSLAPEESEE